MSDRHDLISQFYIKIDGTDVQESFMRDLELITVENSLHLPDVATLVLHDPRLDWVDHADLAPGKTVQISTKVNRGEQLLFDGEIVEIEPVYEPSTQRLTVRAFDRMHRLMRGR